MGLVGSERMKIPKYVNCQNKRILICDYYMLKECPNTCAYARNIENLDEEINVGNVDDITRRIRE